MPNISISVKNKIAVQTNRTLYVCGNSDYTALFDLDAEWNAFEIKTARFCYNGHYSDVVFTGNECEIPIIADTNEFEIGLFAGNLHTTTPAMVLCERSILSTSGTPTDPSPDVYHQLIEKINSGMLRGPQGDPGKDAPQIDDGTITGRADPAHAIAALQAQLAVATQQLAETQAAMVDTTAAIVDYVFEQDCDAIGGGEDADAE